MKFIWNERKQQICGIDVTDEPSLATETPQEEWPIQETPPEKWPREKELLESPSLSPVFPFISSELTGSYFEDGQGH